MNLMNRQLALAGLLLISAGAASAAVDVKYIEPEKFTDVPFVRWQRTQALEDITAHFNKLGALLPAGQDVTIEVLDVDLAGREVPSAAAPQGVRVLQGGADWPSMRLRYTLTQGGKMVKSGVADLSDKSYHDHINLYPSTERLRYEKQMIDDWWQKAIGPTKPARE
jgi:hypothetical protein